MWQLYNCSSSGERNREKLKLKLEKEHLSLSARMGRFLATCDVVMMLMFHLNSEIITAKYCFYTDHCDHKGV